MRWKIGSRTVQVIIDTEKPMSAADLKVLEVLRDSGVRAQHQAGGFPTQAERQEAAAPAEEAPKPPAKKAAAKKAAASRKPTSEATAAPAEPSAPEPAAETAQADSGPTMDDLKARVQELLDADRKPEVLGVMGNLGIKRVGLTTPEQIQPFLAGLNDLG
jgi:hypothetical protein